MSHYQIAALLVASPCLALVAAWLIWLTYLSLHEPKAIPVKARRRR